jgi:putative transposase
MPRSTYYRRRRPPLTNETRPSRPPPPRALDPDERRRVLEVLHSERFVDVAPAEVLATLLSEDVYHCSERTMYRILAAHGEVRERREQLRHPRYAAPELLATAPNQVWSWDITLLRAREKWTYYYLYVLLDIFSRYVIGWLLAHHESGDLAQELIDESTQKHGIQPGQLTVHADRGAAPTSKTLRQKLSELGVVTSYSRPRVSNDNPFSEAHFRTLKYRPDYPDRFDGFQHGHEHCRGFFPWYNHEHRHEGIAMLTPAEVHFGRAAEVLGARQRVLDAAYAVRPERFVHGPPKVASLPEAVWINPPKEDKTTCVVSLQ